MPEPILQVQKLVRRFGGVVATNNVSFEVPRGQILGLIGPNGAGKTTLFSLLVGLHKPNSGTIRLKGTDVTGWAPHKIVRHGMTKTFQNIALFDEMSVLDNVITGALLRNNVEDARAFAAQVLDRVGMGDAKDKLARNLSFPEQSRVEIARALCTNPDVLLLDEVMAALSHAEMDEIVELVRSLQDEGMTIIVIEHHMKPVMKLCERILVLDFGEIIAEGTPAEVAHDRSVIDAYLGTGYRHEQEAQNA